MSIYLATVISDNPCPLCNAQPKPYKDNRFDNCAIWTCGTKVWGNHWQEEWTRIAPSFVCTERRVTAIEARLGAPE